MLDFFNDISFASPEFFWLFTIFPIMIAWYIWKNKTQEAELQISSFDGFSGIKKSLKQPFRHVLFVLRIFVISLLIVALARPQSSSSYKNITTKGIDIVIAMDISGSMLSQDFKPSRIEASKSIAMNFIDSRPNDKIGLVIFSGESFTLCPLTTDHAVIKNLFSSVKTGMIDDGTAIGMGLATAVNRIKDDNSKSKVIILLTDGVNNMGAIAPLTAAEIAKTFGVRVYTIGIGTEGKALTPVAMLPNGQYQYAYQDVQIDEDLLSKIAVMTGGKYFRATDNEKLKNIYGEIDKMEKSRIEEKDFTNKEECFLPFAGLAAILLLLELLLKNIFFKRIP
ncbi:MAG: VWA domain-containing protein [Bacteroidia bacterium]